MSGYLLLMLKYNILKWYHIENRDVPETGPTERTDQSLNIRFYQDLTKLNDIKQNLLLSTCKFKSNSLSSN